jgi:coenzyme F420-reducing hydrogenase delta subunit
MLLKGREKPVRGSSSFPAGRERSSEHRIAGFICARALHGDAEDASPSSFRFPPDFHLTEVDCAGRIDSSMVLRAFAEGADAVIILGCAPGACRSKEGAMRVLGQFFFLRKVLDQLGVGTERLRLEWVSPSEKQRIGLAISAARKAAQSLGPFPRSRLRVR